MTVLRALFATAAVLVALVLQLSLFPYIAWHGVVPNLCLLVVVAAALVRGVQLAAPLGFTAGLLLDLAPPADHVVGRWALALLLVGYVAGRVRHGYRPTPLAAVATVAGCSFIGTSVYALSGVLLGDVALGVGDMLTVIGVALLWDVLLTPLVLPLVMSGLERLQPERARAGESRRSPLGEVTGR